MDLISRQDAIDACMNGRCANVYDCVEAIGALPSAEPEITRCKDCKWYDPKDESATYGYCHAIKHSHYSRRWEINIRRTYEADFYCADAEPKEEE